MNAIFDVNPLALQTAKRSIPPTDLLHQMGCKVCPLAQLANKNPDMEASGAEHPVVYVLGEAPGKDEDREGIQFVGKSGKLLHKFIPSKWRDKIRYNNVVRTRPHKNATPGHVEIECCRPSVVRDIEQSKPKAIFGFGNIPLDWAIGWSGITLWRGRRTPVKIGNHTCWYYPMLHPAYLLRNRRIDERTGEERPSDDELAFRFDLQRALAELKYLPTPRVHTPVEVFAGIAMCTDDMAEVERWFAWAHKLEEAGFDYETDRLRPYAPDSRILSFSIANEKEGFAVALDHPESTWTEKQKLRITTLLKKWMRSKVRKYVHSLTFELEWTGVHFGRDMVRTPNWHCTATQAGILDERRGKKQRSGPFSLEFLVQQHFGFNLKKLSNVDRKRLAREPLHKVLMYNGGDARYHCALGRLQRKAIAEWGLQLPYKLANRRVPTLVLSQIKGVPVDQKVNKRLRIKYAKRIKVTEKAIAKMKVVREFERIKKQKFNPLATGDCMYLFKDMLKRKEIWVEDTKKKEGGRWSVEEDALEKIKHPLAKQILILRKAYKRKSTYLDPYAVGKKNTCIYHDGKLHCTFNSYFAETGRLTCENPNLQNVPKRQEEAKEVRLQIVAVHTKRKLRTIKRVICACDYGQLEARVIGAASKDKVFVKSLWEDYDVHMEWAERLAHAYPARIGGRKMLKDKDTMEKFRGDIKNEWTFPLFFGATLGKAANATKIPAEVLKPLYNEFWRTFTGVKVWQEDTFNFYKENGYVETLTGRRRRAPLRLNQIINSPIQGTAAEIVMDAMCRLSEIGDWDLQPELNIHDDLTWLSLPVDRIDELAPRIITEMLDIEWKWAETVPWAVEMSIGDNWLELEKFGTFFSHHWFGDKTPAWIGRKVA